MKINIKDKRKILSNLLNCIGIFLILYACYFNAIKTISISYIATIIIATFFLMISYVVSKQKKISIYFPSILIVLVILYSKIYSINETITNRFLVTYLIYMLISFLLLSINNWRKYLYNISIIFSMITVIITILTWMAPKWYINAILPNIYSGSQQTMYDLIIYAKSYPGIFASTGVNAFYISVGIAISFSMIMFNDKNKKINFVLLVLCAFSLFLTLKRATLVLNVISILVIILLNNINMRKKIKVILCGIIIIGVVYCIFPDIFNNSISRFKYDSSNELLNGRVELYEFAEKSIENKIFYGFGFGCFSRAYALYNNYNGILLDTHNEILQIASETGIIGVPLIFIPMIYMYFNTIKKFKCTNNKYILSVSLYIQTYFLIYCFIGNPLHDSSLYIVYLLYTISINLREDDKFGKKSFDNNTSV